MNCYCIYFPNGKRYVGVESKPRSRIRDHQQMMTLAPSRKGKPQLVDVAIRKYGWENCHWRYLATNCSREDGWNLERFFIRAFRTQDPTWGYNISSGGRCGSEGCVRTAAMRAHHSAVIRAKKLGPNRGSFKKGHRSPFTGTKGVLKAWNKGIPMQLETRRKLREAKRGKPPWNKGRPMTEEHRRALSESKRGRMRPNSGSFKPGATPPNKGVKTGSPSWNSGKTGLQEANSGTFKPGMGGQRGKIALPAGPHGETRYFRPEQLI